jgi:Mn-containing catalase
MAFQKHLAETEDQVTRLKECFDILGSEADAKPCKGMAGLIEEGDEAIEEGEEQSDTAADLALIAAAQKVEHYEISGYGTARTLAGQAGQPAVAQLLMKTLAEEEIADNLLTQIARELMGNARLAGATDNGVTIATDENGADATETEALAAGPKKTRSRSTTKSR